MTASRFAIAGIAAAALVTLFAAAPACARGEAKAGEAKAKSCAACHGPTGDAMIDPSYPRLAGQYADYIVKALHDYKTGARDNLIMAGFVQTLSDEDIEDLAAFYQAQNGSLKDISHMK